MVVIELLLRAFEHPSVAHAESFSPRYCRLNQIAYRMMLAECHHDLQVLLQIRQRCFPVTVVRQLEDNWPSLAVASSFSFTFHCFICAQIPFAFPSAARLVT